MNFTRTFTVRCASLLARIERSTTYRAYIPTRTLPLVYTPLSADSDTDTIPDGIDFIPRLAVADIYLDRGEEARGENYQNKYGDKSNGSFTNPLYNGPQR